MVPEFVFWSESTPSCLSARLVSCIILIAWGTPGAGLNMPSWCDVETPFCNYHRSICHHFVSKAFSVCLANCTGKPDPFLLGCGVSLCLRVGAAGGQIWVCLPLRLRAWWEQGLGRTQCSAAMLRDKTLLITIHCLRLNKADPFSSLITNEIHLEILS